jgi:hypothetical protein
MHTVYFLRLRSKHSQVHFKIGKGNTQFAGQLLELINRNTIFVGKLAARFFAERQGSDAGFFANYFHAIVLIFSDLNEKIVPTPFYYPVRIYKGLFY